MIGMRAAVTDQHLTDLVLVRYCHTYGDANGLSNHLKILNRVLLQKGSITIYQIYPSFESADQTSSQPHNIDSDALVEIPLHMDPNSRLRQKLSRALDYRFRIKRSLLNVHPYALRHISSLRGLFFRRGWFSMGRFVPLISAEVKFVQESMEKLDSVLAKIRRDHQDRKILFLDHSPYEPYSWMRKLAAKRHRMHVAIQYHGGYSPTNKKVLLPLSRGVASAGVTLSGYDGSLGSMPTKLGSGIDTEFFDPHCLSRGSFRRDLSISEQSRLILVPALVTFSKGHDTLVGAMKLLQRKDGLKDTIVVFAGEESQPYAQALRSDIAHAEWEGTRYVFVGSLNQERLRAAYADADLVVLPSHSEAIPRVVLEAQAMGRFVVATDVGGTAEAMLNGETGLLIPPKDESALADAILRALRGDFFSPHLSHKARQFIVDEYSLDHLAERHEVFYLRAIGTEVKPQMTIKAL